LRSILSTFGRRNYIPKTAFPYTIASGNEYDSGDYEAALDAVLAMGDYRRCAQSRRRRASRAATSASGS
jgi:hypothetical protein